MKIVDIKNIKVDLWDNYVLSHDYGTIFQTSIYLSFFNNSLNDKTFGFALLHNNKIKGLICGVISKNYFFPISLFTRRAVIVGGPLVDNDDNELAKILLNHTVKELKRKSIYLQVRNLRDMSPIDSSFKYAGFTYEEHLDILHDLTTIEEEINRGISKNKRANVRKSLNKGVRFYQTKELEELKKGLVLIRDTYKRIGLPCPNDEFFITAFTNYPNIVKVFLLEYENKIIGIRIELCYKNLVYDWYAGADEAYKNLYPNDVLPYNILLWSKEEGYSTFDFGGAGKPEKPYGVREHKLKFGGKLVNFGRYEIINKPKVFAISKTLLRLIQSIKKE